MKNLLILLPTFLICSLSIFSQEMVSLPMNEVEGVTWPNPEKEYFSEAWDTKVVTNVAKPTMQVFRPSQETNTGTSVIIAPGGGLYGLSIDSEGNDVAKWLNKKGITAFVLRYRLVPTGDDGTAEIGEVWKNNPEEMYRKVAQVIPYSIEDGLNAISHVRKNALKYDINPKKIGFMGFSAGGAVTMGVGYNYEKNNRPDFLAPIYPWTDVMSVQKPKPDVPPMLIICASDDPIGLAKGATELYLSMFEASKPVGLHMYTKGGHGFGMRKNGLPSDKWIERFYEWAIAQGLTQSTM